MQVFKSKIDLWLGLIILGSAALSLLVTLGMVIIMDIAGTLFSLLLLAAGVALPLWILFGTRYIVSAETLKVKSGPFSWDIPIASITSVRNTKNPLSSPALSMDRIQIQYQQGKSLMVSPRDKSEFLAAIKQLS